VVRLKLFNSKGQEQGFTGIEDARPTKYIDANAQPTALEISFSNGDRLVMTLDELSRLSARFVNLDEKKVRRLRANLKAQGLIVTGDNR
jgi:hypothetical protein